MYYPKSQIKTGLYVQDGRLFVYRDTGEPFTGYYWQTSQGKFFAGDGPQQQAPREIIQVTNPAQTEQSVNTNTKLPTGIPTIDNSSQNRSQIIPSFGLTIPTGQDYALGYFNRFFCRRVDQNTYFEINQETYQALSNKNPAYMWEFYTQGAVIWTLIGNASDVFVKNQKQVQLTSTTNDLPHLAQYLQNNYLKYHERTV